MIFQHTWELVLQQKKRRTSRLRRNGDLLVLPGTSYGDSKYPGRTLIETATGKVRWEVGKTYAVQPGRKQRTISYALGTTTDGENIRIINPIIGALAIKNATALRIQITAIERQDVRDITDKQAKDEGFDSKARFFDTWVSIHDPKIASEIGTFFLNAPAINVEEAADLYRIFLNKRPQERYDAWALTFQVVQP